MKYKVIANFKVKTRSGIKEFIIGQVVPVHPNKVVMFIEKGKIQPIVPHLEPDGNLIIPFDCDPKYHWWNGGQNVEATISELKDK